MTVRTAPFGSSLAIDSWRKEVLHSAQSLPRQRDERRSLRSLEMYRFCLVQIEVLRQSIRLAGFEFYIRCGLLSLSHLGCKFAQAIGEGLKTAETIEHSSLLTGRSRLKSGIAETSARWRFHLLLGLKGGSFHEKSTTSDGHER